MTEPQRAVDVLNEIFEQDPEVLHKLVNYRVPCNEVLAEHPSVQVGYKEDDPEKGYEVGFLGILNGIFGVKEDGYGYIAALLGSKTGKLLGFTLLK